MQKRISRFICALVIISMLVVCTGCGGSSPAASQAKSKAPVTAPAAPAGWTEADASETFVYHASQAVSSLDAWAATSNNTGVAMRYLLFDPVVCTNEKGEIIPWLAESWEMADDYSSITFHLRDDIYFTNGELLTAEDLVFSFERLRDDTENLAEAVVKGWRQYLGELEALDQFTFKMNFSQTMPQFWDLITSPNVTVINKAAYQEMGYDEFWKKPVGTGPYVVASWDAPNCILNATLRTDENGYWGYRATNTYTNVKDIVIRSSPEGQTRIASLRAGEVQMIDTIPVSEKSTLDNDGFHTEVLNPTNTVFLQVSSGKSDIFADQKLREALSLCIDRELIVQTLLDGFAIPITWPAYEGQLGYLDEHPIKYDPEKAKQLVAESGYNGEPLDFIFTASTINIGNELSQAIQSMAADVGINLVIRPLEVAVYDEARANHDFDLVIASIGVSRNMWYKTQAEVIGNDRFNTGFQDETLKALGKSLQNVMDENEADKIFKEMFAIETTEFNPNIYLYWPTIISAWDAYVTGINYHALQIPDLHAVVITK